MNFSQLASSILVFTAVTNYPQRASYWTVLDYLQMASLVHVFTVITTC